MYHTFQAATTAMSAPGEDLKAGRSGSRRISTSNACVECRRRKIRCDGAQPCSQCIWYQHPTACHYSKPTQRVVPSRKLVDKLSLSLSQHDAVFCQLFPGKDVGDLQDMTREELINLALTLPGTSNSPLLSAGPGSTADSGPRSDGADDLEALEQAPDQDPEVDEARRHQVRVQGVSDDVNGLSLSLDKQSSYVGASSITAALRVIFKVAPGARLFLAPGPSETALPSRANSPPPQSLNDSDPLHLPPAEIGHALIEAYFNRVHALMPMIDEQQFWHNWLYGERRDGPWLALLNTVFAFGSLASSDADNEQHLIFFRRARQHIDIETFGSGNLLVVQALGLLSGYYLHYINRPNLANNLMGATLRMATVLGLHKEFTQPGTNGTGQKETQGSTFSSPAETRRRTWWSLHCLDTWATITTGRPSLGRTGPGITVQPPRIATEKMNNSQYLASLKVLPLIHNTAFSKLSTRIQDSLATSHLIKFEELIAFDAELVAWHEELPSILVPPGAGRMFSKFKGPGSISSKSVNLPTTPASTKSSIQNPFDFALPPEPTLPATCPDFLKTARVVMHWRYQNLRIVLHRPSLLATALRQMPYMELSAEEKVSVGRCRIIASQAIADIDSMCEAELIAGWNAVWFMYQAVMIPLISLFTHLSNSSMDTVSGVAAAEGISPGTIASSPAMTGGDEDADKWRSQIETAISFFDRMTHWSLAAKKSKDVVARLYEASKQLSQYNAAQLHQQHQQNQQHHQQHVHEYLHQRRQHDPNLVSSAEGEYNIFQYVADANSGSDILDINGQNIWNLTPGGDAAMDTFWNEMQWDSFYTLGSKVPENSGMGYGYGFGGDLDWSVSGGGGGGAMFAGVAPQNGSENGCGWA